MSYDWQTDVRPRKRTAATLLPPETVEESAWDILLALHADRRCELSLAKLGCMVSLPSLELNQWLAALEQRELITGARLGFGQELRAVLTTAGRELIDRYLSATTDLQVGNRH